MIRYERRGDAAWITIDRPEKRNALHLDGWRELCDALDRAAEEARAAVLTGVEDAFSAGDDLAVLAAAETADEVEELVECLYDALFGIETLPVPVVAAVNGLAYGGGCELVAASDLAVAVEDATFALPETKIGAYPPYAVERMAETVGRKRLMELALTGEPIDAATAREWGLLNRVVAGAELESAVTDLVDAVAASPKPATRAAKRYAAASVREAGEYERHLGGFAHVRQDEACRAATESFLEE